MAGTEAIHGSMGGHHSAASGTNEWLTPPEVIAALGGPASFDLDPCAPVTRPWPTASRHLTVEDNGLLQRWDGRVWLNPPYSTALIGKWLGRMAAHGCGVALIFARTETEAFTRFVWQQSSAVLFLEGRLHFHYVDGRRAAANAGAPSVLCAYGVEDADVLAQCGIKGQFVPLTLPRLVAAVFAATWAEVVGGWIRAQRGPVRLDDLYRQFSKHPKARGNRNVEAKIRQTLQRGRFRRVAQGMWEAA
ncbi:DNA N-6-adenine-methyltransferase [Phreatobacter sp. HK31-P]